MTVASGVMMSVFVSPVIAAVTVGKEQKKNKQHGERSCYVDDNVVKFNC